MFGDTLSTGRLRSTVQAPFREGARTVRLGSLGPAFLIVILISVGLSAPTGSASGGGVPTSCTAGWVKISQFDNSFLWTDSGLFAVDSANWQGLVRLYENIDLDCYVVGISVRYTGPLSGGALTLTGSPLVSFTVQYPSAFTSYGSKGVNAYGDLTSWNPPAGGYITYTVATNFNINARGADEFTIKGGGVTAAVTNVKAFFSLPLDFVGSTVIAQIHVGPNKCQCRTTSIAIPGTTRPPPDTTPPATVTDLHVVSTGLNDILLGWTAPGDDGMSGRASQYDFRYSTAGPLTNANFAQGTAFAAPAPGPAGSSESLDVSGLAASTHYWFGLRTADEVPNWSLVSNSPDATTSSPAPPPDTTPPATVTDLHVTSVGSTDVLLGWTAPGDDGTSGRAAQYDLRYSTAGALTDANFAQGTVAPSPTPGPAGTSESLDVTGLASSTHYWFGLRTADEVPNWSLVSNSPDGTTSGAPPPGKTWSVYVHAHEDDWQLFMSPNTVVDYQAGHTLLFIIVTAGDGGGPARIWQAREEAAIASVPVITGTATDTSMSTTICYAGSSQVCHKIWERDYGTTVTFFMRLPDGNSDGGGFSSTGFQTIEKLRDGAIPSINAIDNSTTYTSWQDLYLTVGAIITTVAGSDPSTAVNAPDFDRTRQSFEGMGCNGCADHPDHLAVADLVYNVTIGRGAAWSREWYIDYPICFADSRYPVNMDATQYQTKKNLFMAYNDRYKALTGIDTYAQQPTFWENCFKREYSRVV